MARCRRLRTLRRELRHHLRHTVDGLGAACTGSAQSSAGHSRDTAAPSRLPRRGALEPAMDDVHAGRRWRRLPQANQRKILRFRDAGTGQPYQRGRRHRFGPLQKHLRHCGFRRRDGDGRPLLCRIQRPTGREMPPCRTSSLDVGNHPSKDRVQEPPRCFYG